MSGDAADMEVGSLASKGRSAELLEPSRRRFISPPRGSWDTPKRMEQRNLNPSYKEGLIALTLPRPEDLTLDRAIRYESRTARVRRAGDEDERQVGYQVCEAADQSEVKEPEKVVTVVCFYGAGGSREVYLNLPRLTGVNKFRYIIIDPPAHGETFDPQGEVKFDSWMRDYVLPVLRAEKAQNIIAMGSSMGGLEALYLTALMPQQSIGCVVDNPLIDQADLKIAARVAGHMAKESVIHWTTWAEANRSEFYKERYPVDYTQMKRRLPDGRIVNDPRIVGGMHSPKELLSFLATIPEDLLGSLTRAEGERRDPEFFFFLSRRDEATGAYARRDGVFALARRIRKEVYGIEDQRLNEVWMRGFKGGHLNGYDRPWEYYGANYNAIQMAAEKFWTGKIRD